VRAVLIAVSAVSRSRISPTSMMSGSCLSIDLSAFAKVNPMDGYTCICTIPGMSYSTGSSIVMIFRSVFMRRFMHV